MLVPYLLVLPVNLHWLAPAENVVAVSTVYPVIVLLVCLSVLAQLMPASASDMRSEYFRAAKLLHSGHGLQARAVLLQLAQNPAANPQILCLLADTYLAEEEQMTGKDRAMIAGLMKRTVAIDPDWGNAYKISAQMENTRENYQEAVNLATKALTVKKPDLRAYYHRSIAYQALGKLDLALADMNDCIEKHDHSSDMWIMKASILEQMKRPDDALVAYRNALKEHFRDWTVFRIVAIYEKQAQYEKAIAEIDALVKTNAKDPEAYQIRGRLQARAKHMDAAIADYGKAIALEPNPRFYRERSQLLKSMGRNAAAEADMKKATSTDSFTY